MSGGGAGDRPGAVPSGASGDRHVRPSIRAARAVLLGLDLKRVATVTIVVGGADVPPIVMFAGDPFLLGCGGASTELTYLQARAYRVDVVLEDLA